MENYAWFRAGVGQLFLKGPVHIPGSGGHQVSAATTQLCHFSHKLPRTMQTRMGGCVLIQLFIKTVGGV